MAAQRSGVSIYMDFRIKISVLLNLAPLILCATSAWIFIKLLGLYPALHDLVPHLHEHPYKPSLHLDYNYVCPSLNSFCNLSIWISIEAFELKSNLMYHWHLLQHGTLEWPSIWSSRNACISKHRNKCWQPTIGLCCMNKHHNYVKSDWKLLNIQNTYHKVVALN